jgi:DNA replication protein DnaC
MNERTEAERQMLRAATAQWHNLQPQIAAEKARRGELPPSVLERTNEQLAAIQAHINHLWEEGERLLRIAPVEIPCETCRGAGLVRSGNTNPPTTINCPSCWHSRYAKKIQQRWQLSDKETRDSYKPFVKRVDAPRMEKVFRAVKTYGRNVIAGKADIFAITGPYGIGKTHLMLLLYRQVSDANRGVIFRTANQVREVLQGFNRFSESVRTLARSDMMHVPLLILDEAEKGLRESPADSDKGEWFNSQMLDIINARRNAGLATALAGNNLFILPGAILSRAQEKGTVFLDLRDVPDARPILGGEA